MNTADYEIKFSDFSKSSDLEKLVDLQHEVYPDKIFSVAGFKNWYIENPSGRVISFNAWKGEKIVAHYACIPKKMLINNEIVLGIHSMATVTHPQYRGKGLFKKLAELTYNYARENGYKFVTGVANANSFPGFIKYFPFQFVAQLNVKVGYGYSLKKEDGKIFSGYWNIDALQWRCRSTYKKTQSTIVGNYGKYSRILLGSFSTELLKSLNLPQNKISLKPVLYVGLGAKPKGVFMNVPRFIKRSPFNLIFMDLTEGKLPKMTKDNVFFQLFDFDVA
ncbi:MAG: GNAT family N-acetyltransferase [Bacteroidales bacterium]|nr:GNAT family N-acetyltransferase [Bacteroidales bacterium]